MPLQATSGAASYDAFGGGAPAALPNYIEDVFSTWLYTGTNATQTITNGIDLSGKGGLVWTKARNLGEQHQLIDSARGYRYTLASNSTNANFDFGANIITPSSAGFTLSSSSRVNQADITYASWTFREQSKFFDIVTYTGNGALPNQLISHNLGSVPGCIIIKATSTTANWIVWHRGNGTTNYAGLSLNLTAASAGSISSGDLPTATQFKPGAFFDPDYNNANATGVTYVAYLFAHDAGGFGLTGTDNVISCGSYTGTGAAGNAQTLGYEPQWLMVKKTTSATQSDWVIFDNMRGWPVAGSADNYLWANSSNAEGSASSGWVSPTATGFQFDDGQGRTNASGETYIYIAIRRGPMKVPTTGTSVFNPALGNGAAGSFDTSFPVDFGAYQFKPGGDPGAYTNTRLLADGYMRTGSTNAEAQFGSTQPWDRMEDWYSTADNRFIGWGFRRAPGFFDVVCYTASGSGTTVVHNLAAAPEFIITKRRNSTSNWGAYHSFTPTQNGYNYLDLNGAGFNADYGTSSRAFQSQPTATQFVTGGQSQIDTSGGTYVAYLFATCPGVSKVGSYTGNGTTQAIACGFTGGARFVLIKRTDATGDWYVYDTARGMTVLTDPYLLLNSTAAETATLGSVTSTAGGFTVNASILAAINASGGTYIFLAIA